MYFIIIFTLKIDYCFPLFYLPSMKILIYILLCLIWGSSWIAIKKSMTDITPLYSLTLRFIISTLILYPLIFYKKLKLPASLKEFLILGLPGLFMYGFHYALVYFAELSIDSSLMSVLFASFPLFVGLLSYLFLKEEKLTLKIWLGIILGFLGVLVISIGSLKTSGKIFEGTLLGIVGVVAAAIGMIIHKANHVKKDILVSVTVQMTLGGIPLLLAALIFEDYSAISISAVSAGSILYLAVFSTVIAFLSYYYLMARVTAVVASSTAYVTPLVAIFIGMVFFGESMTGFIIAGAVLILLGCFLISLTGRIRG